MFYPAERILTPFSMGIMPMEGNQTRTSYFL
jgi:hypothetical protein